MRKEVTYVQLMSRAKSFMAQRQYVKVKMYSTYNGFITNSYRNFDALKHDITAQTKRGRVRVVSMESKNHVYINTDGYLGHI